jgi:hypothetical protein
VHQAFAQVETYITDEDINLADVLALLTILEMAFGVLNHIVTTERKLETLKQTNCDFSTYYIEF